MSGDSRGKREVGRKAEDLWGVREISEEERG